MLSNRIESSLSYLVERCAPVYAPLGPSPHQVQDKDATKQASTVLLMRSPPLPLHPWSAASATVNMTYRSHSKCTHSVISTATCCRLVTACWSTSTAYAYSYLASACPAAARKRQQLRSAGAPRCHNAARDASPPPPPPPGAPPPPPPPADTWTVCVLHTLKQPPTQGSPPGSFGSRTLIRLGWPMPSPWEKRTI